MHPSRRSAGNLNHSFFGGDVGDRGRYPKKLDATLSPKLLLCDEPILFTDYSRISFGNETFHVAASLNHP